MKFILLMFFFFAGITAYSQKEVVIVADTADNRVSMRVLENMFEEFSEDTWTVVVQASYLDDSVRKDDDIISLCKFEKKKIIKKRDLKKYETLTTYDIAREKSLEKLKAKLYAKDTVYYLVFKEKLNKARITAYEIYVNIDE